MTLFNVTCLGNSYIFPKHVTLINVTCLGSLFDCYILTRFFSNMWHWTMSHVWANFLCSNSVYIGKYDIASLLVKPHVPYWNEYCYHFDEIYYCVPPCVLIQWREDGEEVLENSLRILRGWGNTSVRVPRLKNFEFWLELVLRDRDLAVL